MRDGIILQKLNRDEDEALVDHTERELRSMGIVKEVTYHWIDFEFIEKEIKLLEHFGRIDAEFDDDTFRITNFNDWTKTTEKFVERHALARQEYPNGKWSVKTDELYRTVKLKPAIDGTIMMSTEIHKIVRTALILLFANESERELGTNYLASLLK